MRTVLSVAGSDCSGGAGIQADIKTMTVNGVYAMSVITALTAQNTLGVRAVEAVAPELVSSQLDAVFEDIFPDAVKIGMIPSPEIAAVISDRLKRYGAKNTVTDPVMVATSGSTLVKNEAIEVIVGELFPLSSLITPNVPEAEALSKMKIKSMGAMERAAAYMGDKYGCAVLLKGGHSVNDANDVLYDNGKIRWFKARRIDNPNTHGTGCTLSSAIASELAKGRELEEAIFNAKEYLTKALSAGLNLGKGRGPLMHNTFYCGEN